jgi:hypothetical protein
VPAFFLRSGVLSLILTGANNNKGASSTGFIGLFLYPLPPKAMEMSLHRVSDPSSLAYPIIAHYLYIYIYIYVYVTRNVFRCHMVF